MPRQNHHISNAGEGPNTLDQMEILNAETYDDEAAVSIARSLTELARQRPGPPPAHVWDDGGFRGCHGAEGGCAAGDGAEGWAERNKD